MTAAATPRRAEPQSELKAVAAAQAAMDKQAEDVVVMDLRALSSVTDFFVLCTAGSAPQIDALREHVTVVFDRLGSPIRHIEGDGHGSSRSPSDPRWVLLDGGDVVVHLLDPRARAFYRLEELWADAPRITVPSN